VSAAGRVERFYGRFAGKLLVRAAVMAYRRGDFHEFDHCRAAMEIGDTSRKSHEDGCRIAGFQFRRTARVS
jgi:hypothetical protein